MKHEEFKEFLEIQIEEINKYKWIRSEEEGRDIGGNCACDEWVFKGYAKNFRIYWEQARSESYQKFPPEISNT